RRNEGTGRRRRRFGEGTLALAATPELLGAQLASVFELLVAEANGQGYDDDVVLLDQIFGEITGAVGHDPDTGHRRSLPREPLLGGFRHGSGPRGGGRHGPGH